MTRAEALRSLARIQELQRSVGSFGLWLRRCKHGSRLHQEIWGKLTAASNEASDLSAELNLFLKTLPENVYETP